MVEQYKFEDHDDLLPGFEGIAIPTNKASTEIRAIPSRTRRPSPVLEEFRMNNPVVSDAEIVRQAKRDQDQINNGGFDIIHSEAGRPGLGDKYRAFRDAARARRGLDNIEIVPGNDHDKLF